MTPVRAVLPDLLTCRERAVEVHDTGSRITRQATLSREISGELRHVTWRLARVHVVGETEPRWIAEERLDPNVIATTLATEGL